MGATILIGLVLSQPGHALGYFALHGWRSFAIQSQGAHAYFPLAIDFSLGLLATLALLTAAALGLGRLALGSALGLKRGRAVSPIDLIVVLAIVQLNVFFFQELAEAQAVGQVTDGAWLVNCVCVAAAGQLPIAILAGLLIAWCSVGLSAALTVLRWALAVIRRKPNRTLNGATIAGARNPIATLAQSFPAAFRKRGPPPRRSLTAF